MKSKTLRAARRILTTLVTVAALMKSGCTFNNHVGGDQHNTLGVPSVGASPLATKSAK